MEETKFGPHPSISACKLCECGRGAGAWICVDAPCGRDANKLSLRGGSINTKGSGSAIETTAC